jgi:peptide methionine sulfoxide reductase MsrA
MNSERHGRTEQVHTGVRFELDEVIAQVRHVEASGLWPGKVVTEVSDAVPFWEAEPEHQDSLQR